MFLGASYFLFQGQRGGWNIKSRGGETSPLSLKSFFSVVCPYYSASIMTIQKNQGRR